MPANSRAAAAALALALAGLLSLGPGGRAAAGGPAPLRHLAVRGHYGGPATAVAAIGRTALLGVGESLLLLDTAFAERPTRLAELALPGPVTDIAVRGSLAFVTYGDWRAPEGASIRAERSGLWILDLAQPATPRRLGGYAVARPSTLQHIALMNDLALLSAGPGGVHVLRVTDPAHPVLLATLAPPEGGVVQLAPLSSRLAYAVTGERSVWLLDISKPGQPMWIEPLPIGSDTRVVLVAGGRMYALQDANVMAFDIADPRQPELIGGQFLNGIPTALAVLGPFVYVSTTSETLDVVDFGRGFDGLTVARADIPDALDMAVSGDRLLLAAPNHGLRVVDSSDVRFPVEIGAYLTAANILQVTVADQRAFVADLVTGLHILDIVDPGQPRLAGIYSAPELRDVAVVGTTAYLAAGPAGLRVVDVSDMVHPREIATVFGQDGVFRVAASGRLALILVGSAAAGTLNVNVLDISDPAAPRDLGPLPVAKFSFISRLALQGRYAYVSDDTGLQIYDLAQPDQPRALGICYAQGALTGMAIDGAVAYVTSDAGIETIDLSNPSNPVPGPIQPTDFRAMAVAAANGQVAAAGWQPAAPFQRLAMTVLEAGGPDRLVPRAEVEAHNQVAGAGNRAGVTLAGTATYLIDPVQGLDILLPFDGPGLYLPWLRR